MVTIDHTGIVICVFQMRVLRAALTKLGVGLGRSMYKVGLNISASKCYGASLMLFMPITTSPICCRLGSCSVSAYVIIPLRPGVL
jgi:hypothetical protein